MSAKKEKKSEAINPQKTFEVNIKMCGISYNMVIEERTSGLQDFIRKFVMPWMEEEAGYAEERVIAEYPEILTMVLPIMVRIMLEDGCADGFRGSFTETAVRDKFFDAVREEIDPHSWMTEGGEVYL